MTNHLSLNKFLSYVFFSIMAISLQSYFVKAQSNTFSGISAGINNSTGVNNSFFGYQTGFSNTTGYSNSFYGSGAGYNNVAGRDNSFLGSQAGVSNSTGNRNVFTGMSSGFANTSGYNNAFFGVNAGRSNTIGNNNTIVGIGADVVVNNLTNASAFGAFASVSQSNSLVLGSINGINGAISDTNVGIGTTTPAFKLDVSVRVDNSDVFEGTGEADVCCNDKESKDAGARIREAITLKVDKETNAILKIDLSDGNFLLSIYPFIGYTSFIGIKRRSFTVSESACPVDEDQNAESETEATAESSLENLRNTKTKRKLSPKGADGESVEEIEGAETFDDPRGGTITYTWSLARCGGL